MINYESMSFTIDNKLNDRLRDYSEKTGISMSFIIRKGIKHVLEEKNADI